MNEFTISSHSIGDWTLEIDECRSETTSELYDRTYTAFRKDSAGKLIKEYFDGIIEMVEFVQEQAGKDVFPYQEAETMMRQSLGFWERFRGRAA